MKHRLELPPYILPNEKLLSLNLLPTNKTYNDSFIHNTIFYETKIKGVYVTNHAAHRDLKPTELIEKNMWAIFIPGCKWFFVSLEFLESVTEKEFYEIIRKQFELPK